MQRLSEIEGLLESGSPLEWALDNLVTLGRGEHAIVFAHPTAPDLVIRISDYPDGFFLHAEDGISNREDGCEEAWQVHMPIVHEIVAIGDELIAIGERLDSIPEDGPVAEILGTLLAWREKSPLHERPETALIGPHFGEFLGNLRSGSLDRRLSNFMLRGDTVVFNDPYSSLPHSMTTEFYARYQHVTAPNPGSTRTPGLG